MHLDWPLVSRLSIRRNLQCEGSKRSFVEEDISKEQLMERIA